MICSGNFSSIPAEQKLPKELITEKFSFKKSIISLVVGLVTALLGVFLLPEAYIIGGIAIAATGIAWGISYAAIGAIPCALALIINNINYPTALACALGGFVLLLAILVVCFRKRVAYRYIAMALAALTFAALYLYFCLPSVLAGEAPYAGLRDYFLYLDEQYKLYVPDVETNFALYAENLDTILYGSFFIVSELVGFLAVVLCKLYCKCFRADVKPMAKFAEWEIAKSLRIGIPVLAAGCIILYAANYYLADVVTFYLTRLIFPLLFIEGVSYISFMFTSTIANTKRKRSKGLVYMVEIFMAILLPGIFICFGLIELYAKRRPKIRKMNDRIREAFEKAEREKSDVVTVDFGDGRGPQIIATRKRGEDIFFDTDDETKKTDGDGKEADKDKEEKEDIKDKENSDTNEKNDKDQDDCRKE